MVDFSNVTNINIPEGEVIKIIDSNGIILWEIPLLSNQNIEINNDNFMIE